MQRSTRFPGRLQEVFGHDKDLFLDFARRSGPDYTIKFGYDNAEDMWNSNPEIEFV